MASTFALPKSGENAAATVRKAWEIAQAVPFGKQLMSRLIGRLAPYTGTISANIIGLEEGRSRVELEDRPGVRNHLKCIHAVALVNLAELAGNAALAYSMPSDARFIVAGLSIDYKKKARGRITAEGICPAILSNARAEYAVHVTLRDAGGDVVATSTLRTLVGPLRAPSIERVTGVYQAGGGLAGELRYALGKLQGTAHCALCDITHGGARKKPGFERCEAALPVPLELVHLNERSKELRAFTEGKTPCMVGHTPRGLVMLLGAEDLEKMGGSVGAFEAALREALDRHGAATG